MGKQHPIRSAAQKNAHKVTRARGLPKEKKRVEDTARTTFGKLKPDARGAEFVAEAAEATKGKYTKLPGTRIQMGAGGVAFRVVVEDGKRFEPEQLWSAKQHMVRLAKGKEEAAEIRRLRGEDPIPCDVAGAGSKVAKVVKKVKRKHTLTKKERKALGHKERQNALEELRSASTAEGGRTQVSEARYGAEVIQRSKGFAWARLSVESAALPENVRQKMEERKAEACPGATVSDSSNVIRVRFFDVEDAGLNLQVGVRISLLLYLDKDGVGGCSVTRADGQLSVQADTSAEPAAEAAKPEDK